MYHFWAQNGPFAPNKYFFWKKLLMSFSSIYWPFSLCKILKKFLQRIQSYGDASFLGPKWPICPTEDFLQQIFMPVYMPKMKLNLLFNQLTQKLLMEYLMI